MKENIDVDLILRDLVHRLNNWIGILTTNFELINLKIDHLNLDPDSIQFFNRRLESLKTSIENGKQEIQKIKDLI